MPIIGITGHRFLAESGKLERAVDRALNRILRFYPDSRPVALSPLAEGADRLAVHRVLARDGAGLVAALPLPEEDYLTDFESAESVAEFLNFLALADDVIELPLAATRREAYEAVGRYVLDRCDVLIAIWDGQGDQGHGGTGSTVGEARRRGLPLAWVHAGNRVPGTLEATSLGDEQGKVTYERFPRAHLRRV